MPAQTSKSGLLTRLGNTLVQAHLACKDDAPSYGNQQLPAGIEGGVAQLIECHIGEFKDGPNKGHPFFMASGTVKLPREKDGITTAGMRTSIGPEPICDTPQASGDKSRKTTLDHWRWVLNQVRILAGIHGEMNLGTTPEEIDRNFNGLLAALSDAKPHFRFRTWKGKKQDIGQDTDGKWYLFATNDKGERTAKVLGRGPYPSLEVAKAANPYAGQEPRVVQEWNGACDHKEDEEAVYGGGPGGMEDSSARPPNPQANGSVQPNGPANTTSQASTPAPARREPPARTTRDQTERQGGSRSTVASLPPAPVGNTFDEFGDIDSLIASAEAQNSVAQDELREFALAKGATEAEIDSATDWAQVAELAGYKGHKSAPATAVATVEPDGPDEPAVGGVYSYAPKDRKTGRPGKTVYQCEVTLVDHSTSTCSLKNLEDQRKGPYVNVPWADLQLPK